MFRTLVFALAAMLVFTGCQTGEQKPTRTPAAAKPGSTRVQGFAFVPPTGLSRVTDDAKRRNAKASVEMVGTTKSKAGAPALYVFVEKNEKVGSAKVRATSVLDIMKSSLTDVKVVRSKAITIPGAQAAWIVEATFTCTDQRASYHVPCRQVEVFVQMPDAPQYGVRYGMPESDYRKADVDKLVGSLRVTRK